jgi:hypothetical protein
VHWRGEARVQLQRALGHEDLVLLPSTRLERIQGDDAVRQGEQIALDCCRGVGRNSAARNGNGRQHESGMRKQKKCLSYVKRIALYCCGRVGQDSTATDEIGRRNEGGMR